MRYRCIIVDDDPISANILLKYIGSVPALDLVSTCSNSLDAYNFLITQKIDLAFLDIQMPNLSGVDLVKSLKQPPAIIFTTAHENFALEAFNLDAVDYLLKPLCFERFLRAINKFIQSTSQGEPATYPACSHIYFRTNRKMVKITMESILYLECLKDYVLIHRSNEPGLKIKQAFSTIEATLPPNIFLRIHRSFIVARPKVTAFSRDFVEIGKIEIPIGRNYKNVFTVLAGD